MANELYAERPAGYNEYMTTMIKPKPGSFGLSTIGGRLGRLIAAGQALTGDGSRFTHAFLVLDNEQVIEAMPGGARITSIAKYLKPEAAVFSDKPIQAELDAVLLPAVVGAREDYESYLRAKIVDHGRELEGTPYNFLDYLALSLKHLGINSKLIDRRIQSSGRLICSQLVDFVYMDCGIHLFDDGRLSSDVTPGDLDIYRTSHLDTII